ncbi:hypothetical protein ACFQ88_10250 [Paenibacillus sp. NPDC056579]|uniref:hypothetical protein n=1 Tax=Paenibacillus sp. NPDC056579 TaxID=3345871 RepID=UPI0036904DF1
MAWTEAVEKLWNMLRDHRPSLYPMEEWDDLHDIRISKLPQEGLDSRALSNAKAVKAGLHLLNESLEASHKLSQELHTPLGSYWHAIMHRMEGDYGNSKYWFRQGGAHPVGDALQAAAKARVQSYAAEAFGSDSLKNRLDKLVSGPSWDPYLFVDIVEQQVTVVQNEQAEELLTELQWVEIKLLVQYSFQQTGGHSLEL